MLKCFHALFPTSESSSEAAPPESVLDVVSVPGFDDRAALIVRALHRLGRRTSIVPVDLGAAPPSPFDRTSSHEEMVSQSTAAFAFVPVGSIEIENAEVTKRLVQFGTAVALLPIATVADKLTSGVRVALDISDGTPLRHPDISIRRQDAGEPAKIVERFLAVATSGRSDASYQADPIEVRW